MANEITYEQLLSKLVDVYKWPEEAANKFIFDNAKDENIKKQAQKFLEKRKESENNQNVKVENTVQKVVTRDNNKTTAQVTINRMPKKKKKYKLIRTISKIVMTVSIAALAVMTQELLKY